ncbi:MAG: hypothetical protein AABY86_09775 [Bdellovibrionota bacterium]
MKKILLLLSVILLTSCVEKVRGTFEAKRPLTLRGKDGSLTLTEGVHSAVLKIKQKKSATILVEANGRKSKVRFNLPRGLRLPTNSGQVRLTSLEVGQPYDVNAAANTSVSNSGPRTSVESCSRSVVRPVCSYVTVAMPPVCHTDRYGRRICHTPPPTSRRICRNEWTNVYGQRQVTYEYRGETTEFNFTLLDPSSQEVVGRFNGYDYDANRVVTGYGPCYVYGTGVLIQ